MSKTILLADDSKTIQKVIRITLSQEPYEIDMVESDDQLLEKITSKNYSLILLDFGLSESKSGYDLAREVIEKSGGAPTIMLFGTFDSVDENMLNEAGVTDKIIKPFDSQHFIKLVNATTGFQSTGAKPHVPTPEPAIPDVESDLAEFTEMPLPSPIELGEAEAEDSNWQMDLPTPPVMDDAPNLDRKANDWSIEVPPIIGNKDVDTGLMNTDDVPPVIDEEDEKEITESFQLPADFNNKTEPDPIPVPEPAMPQTNDLAYPEPEPVPSEPTLPNPDSEFTEVTINISEYEQKHAKEIEQKLESVDDGEEDFWAVDEEPAIEEEVTVAAVEDSSQPRVSIDIEENISQTGPIEPNDNSAHIVHSAPDVDEIVEKLKPFIEEKIKEYCEQAIEKVAWEVIPDLAENLIKRDLEEIKEQTLNQ